MHHIAYFRRIGNTNVCSGSVRNRSLCVILFVQHVIFRWCVRRIKFERNRVIISVQHKQKEHKGM